MDEKLENRLRELRACKFVTNSTMLQIGQAFKDAGWTEPQQPAEGEHSLLETARKVQVCMHNLESQKELISVVDTYDDSTKNTLTSKFTPKDWIAVGAKAQLAHDKATMVKLPNEDELAPWLCDHLNCTSRELAQELLKLLNGCEILEVLAEFDRLTVRNVNLQTCLDTICEPIRTDGDIDYIKRTVIPLLYEQCKTISAQTLERVLAYLDSQKPSEKPSCCHQPNLGGDCPICNPPITQCPECIWGQKRREFTAVEGAYCKYVVYERCPRCKGEGRIPC